MKLLSLIRTSVIVLLSVSVSGLTIKEDKAVGRPDHADTFRSDTTLRFMRKIHSSKKTQPAAKVSEAVRSSLCARHGYKTSQRSSCIHFMDQACHKGGVQKGVGVASCMNFFGQEQPGYGHNLSKVDQPGKMVGDTMKDMQKGSQKVESVVGQKDKKVANPDGGNPLGDANKKLNDVLTGEAAADAMDDATKAATATVAPKERVSKKAEESEEAEEKEVPSVPGCHNSPKNWEDTKGNDCEDYAEGEWCNRRGGETEEWMDDWGSFEDVATFGNSAPKVCCVCGGGRHPGNMFDGPVYQTGGAPSPAGAGSPNPAPMPAPASPQWDKLGRPLPVQGFKGKLVEHEDQVTMTDDWGMEFGPRAGHRDIRAVCAEHPGNEWCDVHGYYDKGAAPLKSMAAVFGSLLLICLW